MQTISSVLIIVLLTTVTTAFCHIVQNGVPDGVTCEQVLWCAGDGGTTTPISRRVPGVNESAECSVVCQTGSVAIAPWLEHAMSVQNGLARQLSICYATLDGTHNSAITLANGYGNSDAVYNYYLNQLSGELPPWAFWRTNNQWLSLTDQLRLGARSLEIDTHWFDGELRIAHCGGVDLTDVNELVEAIDRLMILDGRKPIDWDTETLGCQPSFSNIPTRDQRSFASALQEVVDWMTLPGNEQEFVVLMLDCQDDLLTWGKVPVLEQTLDTVVGQTVGLFTPQDYAALGYRWPRLVDMVRAGKRVLVAVDADIASNTTNYFLRTDVCAWTEPDLFGWTYFPNCSIGTVRANVGQLVRIETDAIQYGPFNSGGGWGLSVNLNASEIPSFVDCNVNMPAPDLYTPQVAESAVWTWAPGQPLANASQACAIVDATANGRWFGATDCSIFVMACQSSSSSSSWQFVPNDGRSCPDGSSFSFPRTAYDNQLLVTAMLAQQVQLAAINYPALLKYIDS